ncbi:MAG: hypothetical protein R3358_05105 [Woeseiaceae bacterium]|nr:hypothetical protein [Woeseiaceae bacterium]
MMRVILAVLVAAMSGCASNYVPRCEVGEKGGWTRLDLKPANAAEILAKAPADERELLLNSALAEWFVREDDAYLICMPGRRPVCGQTNYHIEKSDNGWAQPFRYGISCP